MRNHINDSIVLYTDKRGNVELRTDVKEETLWATQAQIAQLFDVNPQAISKHLKNIYEQGELSKVSTCSKMEQVQIERGRVVKRKIDFYTLDAIIAVGYKVNSIKATKFRIWATGILREYLTKGFKLDQRKLTASSERLADLHDAIEFMESESENGQLKAKVSIKMTKDLIR